MNGTVAAGLNRLMPATSELASAKVVARPRHLSAETRNTAAEPLLPSEEEGGERRERKGVLFTFAMAGVQSKARGRALSHAAFLTLRARRSIPPDFPRLGWSRRCPTHVCRRSPTSMVYATPARA